MGSAKIFLWVFFCFLSINSYALQNSFQETDFSKPILLNQDTNQFSVSLWSTPGTGYVWRIKSYDSAFVVPVSKTFQQSYDQKPGARGLETFTFIVNKSVLNTKQSSRLIFIYVRPWNKEIGRTVTYKITVQQPKSGTS